MATPNKRNKPMKPEAVKQKRITPMPPSQVETLFKTGNGFWKLRTKHGRDRVFETPEILWEAACEYFKACEDNPLYETDYKGQHAMEVQIPKMRAFSMKRLCLFLHVNTQYFNEFKRNLSTLPIELQSGFSGVIATIEETVYSQKFEGAAAGFLNANIISRELGLQDHLVADVNDNRKRIDELYPREVDPGEV